MFPTKGEVRTAELRRQETLLEAARDRIASQAEQSTAPAARGRPWPLGDWPSPPSLGHGCATAKL